MHQIHLEIEKMVFGWQRKFSKGGNYSVTMIYSWGYAFNRSDVGRISVLLQLNASIHLRQNLNKILRTVEYTKDLWYTTWDLTVKYTDQPKIGLVLVLLRLLVFSEMKITTEVNF